jgi:hypothetical protein
MDIKREPILFDTSVKMSGSYAQVAGGGKLRTGVSANFEYGDEHSAEISEEMVVYIRKLQRIRQKEQQPSCWKVQV